MPPEINVGSGICGHASFCKQKAWKTVKSGMAEEAQETSAQVEQVVNKRLGETDVQDFSLWHHLIFCQDLENDDENGALCRLCNETVSGPAYKCSKCNFHQHKLCIDRPHGVDIEAEHKYWWKRHHLILVLDLDRGGEEKIVVCSGCKEPTFGPAYKCSIPECTFLLHKSCGNLPSVIAYPEHPEHSLFLQEPSSTTNNCVSCRKNFSGSVFYRCYLCSFNVDIRCLNPWRVNANDCHQHKLFPLPKQMQFICKSCGEEINGFAYLCSECRVLIHRECDSFPHTINTTVHDHFLNRTYYLPQFEDKDIVFCKLCYEKVNTEYAAYYCWECGYVVHLKCAKEYETTELVASNSVGYLTHLVHLVEGINLAEDQKVGLREINHFSHPQHNLILGNEKLIDDMRCKACMQFIILAPFYGCAQCKFFLHNRCAKLPATIKRGLFHEHSLTLNSSTSSMDRFLRCRACTRKSPGFTYRCGKCFYSLDVQCCLIPETLKHEGHQHSLFLAKSSFHICNACGENWKGGVNFKCTHCKFILCIRCATLPLVAKYQYDKHLLKLSYKREDNLEEHYCLICEEERDYPDFWFYGCVECKFTAHLKCILGKYPCINYGITFMRGSDHPHPVTSVEKTEDSTPCDVCHESFVDMALECTACKSVVHEDCLIDLYYEESESSEGSEEKVDTTTANCDL